MRDNKERVGVCIGGPSHGKELSGIGTKIGIAIVAKLAAMKEDWLMGCYHWSPDREAWVWAGRSTLYIGQLAETARK